MRRITTLAFVATTVLAALTVAAPAQAKSTTGEGTAVLMASHSSLCLDVEGNSQDNLAQVIQFECHSDANQRVNFIPGDLPNTYFLMMEHSGKCLDVEGASKDNWASVVQYECNGQDNQLFFAEKMGDTVRFRAAHSDKCLDVEGASKEEHARVIQYTCANAANQKWIRFDVQGKR